LIRNLKINSGNTEKFDYLISTIPLPEFLHLTPDLPRDIQPLFKKLKWNSIFNLNLGLEEERGNSGRHWVYFPDKEVSFFRAGFPHNFSSDITPEGKSSIYIEASYSKEKPIDRNKIVPRIKEDLRRIGILKKETAVCCQDITDIKYGYPIYDRNYNTVRKKILEYLIKNKVIPCGRYGGWRYLSMEDVILHGKETAEYISKHV